MKRIFFNAIPLVIMIGLIPFIVNDYFLTCVYILIIVIAFSIKKEPNDLKIFIFGFLVMIVSETFFISSGVEIFVRNSLFGIMPLWLPFLWAYGFVVIKKSISILES